jgi:hypothetical protein
MSQVKIFWENISPIILLIDRRARWAVENCVVGIFVVWVQLVEYLDRSNTESRYSNEFLSFLHGRVRFIQKEIESRVIFFNTAEDC